MRRNDQKDKKDIRDCQKPVLFLALSFGPFRPFRPFKGGPHA
jgi:hypothetical protein